MLCGQVLRANGWLGHFRVAVSFTIKRHFFCEEGGETAGPQAHLSSSKEGIMSSFLGRVARLAAALGVPDEGGAAAVLRSAAAAMGEQPKAGLVMCNDHARNARVRVSLVMR